MRRHADIQVLFYSAQEIRKIQHGHAVWMDDLHGFLHWLGIKCNLIVIEVKVTHMCIDFMTNNTETHEQTKGSRSFSCHCRRDVPCPSVSGPNVVPSYQMQQQVKQNQFSIGCSGYAGRSCRSSGMQLSCDPGLKQPEVRLTHDMRLWRRAVICPALTVQLKRKNLQNAALRGEPLYSLLNLKRT